MQAMRADLASVTSSLAACLDGSIESLARIPHGPAGDWEGLIRAACRELVLPALGGRLREVGVQPPPEVAEFLATVEELNCARNIQILDEMRTITSILNGEGIEPVALKGAAFLLAGVYPEPGCRYLCDLDLLVPHSDLPAAAEALERAGYRQDGRDAMARFRHHYPQLQLPCAEGVCGVPVELHHSLGHGVSRRILSGEEMVRGSQLVEWNGVRIRVPSPEHLATHLILHSQVHHSYSERIWPPIRAMYDLAVLDRHFGPRIPWADIHRRFRSCGHQSTLLLHLLQVRKTLGMPLPFAFELGWSGRARWLRRQALNRWPALRMADPIYLASATLSRRIQFLTSIISAPGGWKSAAQTLVRPGFYRRLLAEIVLR
jgi:Uncharacterised nucleotidyltransferase